MTVCIYTMRPSMHTYVYNDCINIYIHMHLCNENVNIHKEILRTGLDKLYTYV